MFARHAKTIALALTAPACLITLASVANAQEETAAAASQGPQCIVAVSRDQEPGFLDIAREVFPDGSCTCYISTGPDTQGVAIEGRITSILESRRCPAARVITANELAAGGGGGGAGLGAALAAAGGVAGVLALGDGDNEPVSP